MNRTPICLKLRCISTWFAATATTSRINGRLTTALRDALQARDVPVAMPTSPHILGIRPSPAQWEHCVRALEAAHIDITSRHGVLRVAPHLHVDLDDMRRVADVLARALRE